MDAADFPGEGNPLNSPESAAAFPDDMNIAPNSVDRKAIDNAISSLGGPIHKTIVWYMNNRGVFGDSRKVDTSLFYQNLKELLGPGADMIKGGPLTIQRFFCLYHSKNPHKWKWKE